VLPVAGGKVKSSRSLSRVQADRRLVQDVEDPNQPRADRLASLIRRASPPESVGVSSSDR
jgi:hypothetical protein